MFPPLKQKLQSHTAVALRAVEHYAGSGRVIIADAGFGSVPTACAMYVLLGLFLIGNVKGCSFRFPVKYCKAILNIREDNVYMTTDHFKSEDKPIPVALSGDQDKQPMLIIQTAAAHVPGPQQERKRSRYANGKSETSIFYLAQDVAHWLYRKLFNLVDLHNRARHGDCTAIWDVWATKSWETRIFSTLLSIIFVNTTNIRQPPPIYRDESKKSRQ